MKTCPYCGRENEDSATRCGGCLSEWQMAEVRQPIATGTKMFIALCIAAPGALVLAFPVFALSVRVSAICTIVGLLLSCVLFVWSLLSLFRRWQRALLGFGCLLVAFWFLIVMADIFAAYYHRKQPTPRVVTASLEIYPVERIGEYDDFAVQPVRWGES
jgi:hypothetical protein